MTRLKVRRTARAAVVLSTAIALALPLSACNGRNGSGFGSNLMALTWAITQDLVDTLPFAKTLRKIVEVVEEALDEGGTIGIAGFLPSLDNDGVSLGVTTRFMPDWLQGALADGKINVEDLPADALVGEDGKPILKMGPDGQMQIVGDPSKLPPGMDYVLAGVVDPEDNGLGMQVRLVKADGSEEPIVLTTGAAYDGDTLALLGASRALSPPTPLYSRCEGSTVQFKPADTPAACQLVGRSDDSDNRFCISCPATAAGAGFSDGAGNRWDALPSGATNICMRVAPYVADGAESKPSYPARVEGTVAGTTNVAGASGVQLGAGAKYVVIAKKNEEYVIELSVDNFVHTGTNTPRRLAVYLGVDGVNSIGQQLDIPTEGQRWVINPGSPTLVPGWQMSNSEALRFKFVSFGDAVAVRLGAEENVGQITGLLYAEKDRGCPDGPLCDKTSFCAAAVARAPSDTAKPSRTPRGPMARPSMADPGMGAAEAEMADDAEKLGTGEGEKIEQNVKEVSMELEESPMAVITVHYRGEKAPEDKKPLLIVTPQVVSP